MPKKSQEARCNNETLASISEQVSLALRSTVTSFHWVSLSLVTFKGLSPFCPRIIIIAGLCYIASYKGSRQAVALQRGGWARGPTTPHRKKKKPACYEVFQ